MNELYIVSFKGDSPTIADCSKYEFPFKKLTRWHNVNLDFVKRYGFHIFYQSGLNTICAININHVIISDSINVIKMMTTIRSQIILKRRKERIQHYDKRHT